MEKLLLTSVEPSVKVTNVATDDGDMLTTRQTAELLGRTVSSVHRYTVEGRLAPAMKIDGLRGPKLFARADVEALAAELAGEAA